MKKKIIIQGYYFTKKDDFINHMNNLKLSDPKMMDVAVPANLKLGLK